LAIVADNQSHRERRVDCGNQPSDFVGSFGLDGDDDFDRAISLSERLDTRAEIEIVRVVDENEADKRAIGALVEKMVRTMALDAIVGLPLRQKVSTRRAQFPADRPKCQAFDIGSPKTVHVPEKFDNFAPILAFTAAEPLLQGP
jgi:hypothetical protein